MNEAVAREFRALRAKNNYSLENVSECLNISRETLRRYENNETKFTIEFIEKLLDFYKQDASIFFTNVCTEMYKINNKK